MRIDLDGLVKILNGPVGVAFAEIRDSPAAIGGSKLRIDLDGLVIILNGPIVVAFVGICVSPVVIGGGVIVSDLYALVVPFKRLIELFFFFQNDCPPKQGLRHLGPQFQGLFDGLPAFGAFFQFLQGLAFFQIRLDQFFSVRSSGDYPVRLSDNFSQFFP